MTITGDAAKVLMCERTALNLLTRMSGIATQTNFLVKKIPSKIKLYATRKTAPGLRYFDKEAVEIGGGKKHRLRLDEMVMIKDNHIAIHDSLEELIKKAKKKHKKFEVEVENISEAILAAKNGAAIIMLDNFTPSQIKKAIVTLKNQKLRSKVLLEASGGINSKNITAYGMTGVDIISVGSITNSVKGIDMSLEIQRGKIYCITQQDNKVMDDIKLTDDDFKEINHRTGQVNAVKNDNITNQSLIFLHLLVPCIDFLW